MLDQRDINIDIDKFIYNLFDFALNNKVSDIHIDQRKLMPELE